MKPEEIKEKADKISRNSSRILPKLLKYLKKIETFDEYDEYIKSLNISLIDWIIEYFIKFILILICLFALSFYLPPLEIVLLAASISLLWFLIIEFKKDLWRRE